MNDNIYDHVHNVTKYVIEFLTSPFHVVSDVAKIFKDYDVDYAVTGAVAMAIHNYKRDTDNIDILVSRKGFEIIKNDLFGHYFHFRKGSQKKLFYDSLAGKIEVDLIVEGDNYSGVILPDPKSIRTKMNGVWYINLSNIIEIKIAAGYESKREQDWPDVIRLIRENELPENYYKKLDQRYKEKFVELWIKSDGK